MNGDDRLSIKEFSKLTGIKQTTLRYYDDLGLFSPSMRGENNYRYYSPQQLITINSINLLHTLDMPIKQISEIQRNRSPETVYDVLGDKEGELEAQLRKIERSYNVIRTLREMIATGMSAREGELSIMHVGEQRIIIGGPNDFGNSSYFYETFSSFCVEATEHHVDLRFPVGGMFNTFEVFRETPSQPSYFFSADPNGADRKAAGRYLTGYGRGYYGEMGDMPERMGAYLSERALTPDGPLYVIYLHDEICIQEQHNYLFQASIKVK
jgi:DNA-binding transcriptional MerR regulator